MGCVIGRGPRSKRAAGAEGARAPLLASPTRGPPHQEEEQDTLAPVAQHWLPDEAYCLSRLPGVLRVYCAFCPRSPFRKVWIAAWKARQVSHPNLYNIGMQPVVWAVKSRGLHAGPADTALLSNLHPPENLLLGTSKLQVVRNRPDVVGVSLIPATNTAKVWAIAPQFPVSGLPPLPRAVEVGGTLYTVQVCPW